MQQKCHSTKIIETHIRLHPNFPTRAWAQPKHIHVNKIFVAGYLCSRIIPNVSKKKIAPCSLCSYAASKVSAGFCIFLFGVLRVFHADIPISQTVLSILTIPFQGNFEKTWIYTKHVEEHYLDEAHEG